MTNGGQQYREMAQVPSAPVTDWRAAMNTAPAGGGLFSPDALVSGALDDK